MNKKIIERIKSRSQGKDILDFLVHEISPSDLQSLLLSIFSTRAAKLSPHTVLRQYRENRFVRPSTIDPLRFLDLNRLAYSLLPDGFKPIELSPLAPLGSSSCLGPVSQNIVVSTVRNTEVVSDSSNILALECARRRKEKIDEGQKEGGLIRLATSQRQVRAQMFDIPHAFAHFLLFALCTAGRDRGSFQFHTEVLKEHIGFYIKLLTELKSINLPVSGIRMAFYILNPRFGESVRMDVCKSIGEQFPAIDIDIDPEGERGEGYYRDVRFNIFASDKRGEEYFLADGGFTDWTQKLLQNRKERLLTSGIGLERISDCFA